MNHYLFFRTDRIGDFLLSSILFKSIKRNDPDSKITVIGSEKNYYYIKTFDFIDTVIQYPSSFFKKIIFFFKIRKNKYKLIGALDGKKRSIYICILLKSKIKVILITKNIFEKIFSSYFNMVLNFNNNKTRIDEIKEILSYCNFDFKESDLNIFQNRILKNLKLKNIEKNFILFHFDEKWIYNDYIKKYKSIEPSYEELNKFLENLLDITKSNIVITTGVKSNAIQERLLSNFNKTNDNEYSLNKKSKKINIIININFFDLEHIIKNCNLLISCHGAATHLAGGFNKKIIDIYDESQKVFYTKWNSHFRNYTYLYRKDFSKLSKEILNLI